MKSQDKVTYPAGVSEIYKKNSEALRKKAEKGGGIFSFFNQNMLPFAQRYGGECFAICALVATGSEEDLEVMLSGDLEAKNTLLSKKSPSFDAQLNFINKSKGRSGQDLGHGDSEADVILGLSKQVSEKMNAFNECVISQDPSGFRHIIALKERGDVCVAAFANHGIYKGSCNTAKELMELRKEQIISGDSNRQIFNFVSR